MVKRTHERTSLSRPDTGFAAGTLCHPDVVMIPPWRRSAECDASSRRGDRGFARSAFALARIGGADFRALDAPLLAAFVAPAAVRLDVGVEVVLAVVVVDLGAGLDVLDRLDADAPVADDRVGVRPAGMVDVARDVRTRRA